MKVKILVIEDDQEIIEAISPALQTHWPEAGLISSRLGKRGIELAKRRQKAE